MRFSYFTHCGGLLRARLYARAFVELDNSPLRHRLCLKNKLDFHREMCFPCQGEVFGCIIVCDALSYGAHTQRCKLLARSQGVPRFPTFDKPDQESVGSLHEGNRFSSCSFSSGKLLRIHAEVCVEGSLSLSANLDPHSPCLFAPPVILARRPSMPFFCHMINHFSLSVFFLFGHVSFSIPATLFHGRSFVS